ncbi:MAG: hypothetical protein JSS83_00015 [Cyanobacteria bacterium SZAS LIN-3]|nr:hypothetical protein [Cyanobacteria bacterium SZAS LIN-3]
MSESAEASQKLKLRFRLEPKHRWPLLAWFVVASLMPAYVSYSLSPVCTAQQEKILVVLPVFTAFLYGVTLVGFVAALALVFTGSFRHAKTLALQSLLIGSALVLGLFGSDLIHRNAYVDLAERSRGLVNAIERFERKNGSPPPNLDALVPNYLDKIPWTMMGAYPNYEYSVFETKKPVPWALQVRCPRGLCTSEVFVYWPAKNYSIPWGHVQRIGDWAYVRRISYGSAPRPIDAVVDDQDGVETKP